MRIITLFIGFCLLTTMAFASEKLDTFYDVYVYGDEDAPVKIEEFASLSCSHCANFHKKVFPEIKEQYIDTGKVQFAFYHFPLDEPALRGAMLLQCVGEEQYARFLNVLFKSQRSWAYEKNYLEILANIAKLGGISSDDFDACMADEVLRENLLKAKLDVATKREIRSTPTIFIEGKKYHGEHEPKAISKIIDSYLEPDDDLDSE